MVAREGVFEGKCGTQKLCTNQRGVMEKPRGYPREEQLGRGNLKCKG